jgi:hypothetical protein
MRQRCQNPNAIHFDRYGGRGIKVCERWEDFETFAKDMGQRPAGATLERIENDGHYCPSNCRWATRQEQARNRSSNRIISFRGRSQTLAAWSEELGLSKNTVSYRDAHRHPIDGSRLAA